MPITIYVYTHHHTIRESGLVVPCAVEIVSTSCNIIDVDF